MRLREGDTLEQELGYVIACCYYCHEQYIPVPLAKYSAYVAYNCGCHKYPMDEETKIVIGMTTFLASIILAVMIITIAAINHG